MNYSRTAKYLILFIFCLSTGCQNSEYSNPVVEKQKTDINPTPPMNDKAAEGFINGRAWQFVSGTAFIKKRNKRSYLEIKLWNQTYSDPCKEPQGSPYKVRLFTENRVGSGSVDPNDPFAFIPTIMFSDFTDTASNRNNMIAHSGLIDIKLIANKRILGSVSGAFLAPNIGKTEIFGNFEVPLCEQKMLQTDY